MAERHAQLGSAIRPYLGDRPSLPRSSGRSPAWPDDAPSVGSSARSAALDDAVSIFRRHLYLPDPRGLYVVLGTVVANLLTGDPVWTLLVGVPGCGKTELLMPLTGLDFVSPATTVTPAAMLSGTARKDVEAGATGGLLRQMGDFGILLFKDFTSVLAQRYEARAEALGALREVFDGRYDRPVGSAGGRVLTWEGKVGLLGACTPTIDRHAAVMGVMGERTILYRLAVPDLEAQARRRLRNRGNERVMRAELADAIGTLLGDAPRGVSPRPLVPQEEDFLVRLSVFVGSARAAVERDGVGREVVVMPTAEAPARLVGALGALMAGMEGVGVRQDEVVAVLEKVAWDSVPDMRRHVLRVLHGAGAPTTTASLAAATKLPRTPLDRVLEDLELLGLVESHKLGSAKTAVREWWLSERAVATWPTASPETSVPRQPQIAPACIGEFSGEVP